MRAIIALALLVGTSAAAGAQERLADQLRKGMAQEETGRDPEKAIQAYQAIVARFDEDRAAAATALYRLAECYRKAGRVDQANAAYRRVVREFPDQAAAEPSRQQLGDTVRVDERPVSRQTAEEILNTRRSLAESQRELDASRSDVARDPRAIMAAYSRAGDSSALEAARVEMGRIEKGMLETERRVRLGEASQATLDDLRGQYSAAKQRYDQLASGRDPATLSAADPRSAAGDTLAGVEKEIVLVQARLGALEQRVTAGTLSNDDPDLVQLRRDLAALQLKAAELRKAPAC